ncbi:MAG: hypothetical protein CSA31_02470 [Desulfobulbus propionicus]|nr:MAG: hypothetical protein CSA31_02470 [Desulfobulbus propionicus]
MDYSHLPLQPYHLPEPVSWWPPAPGWIILAIALLIVIGIFVLLSFRWRAQAWRRAAGRELDTLQASYHQGRCSGHVLAARLSILLRRICLTRFSAEAIAGCTGECWQQWLEKLCNGKVSFSSGKGRELLHAAYDKQGLTDETHIQLCRKWLNALPAKPIFSFGNRLKKERRQDHV